MRRWLALARAGAFKTIDDERESLIDTLVDAVHVSPVRALAFELGLAVDATMQWQGRWDEWYPALPNVLLAAQTADDRATQAWLWGRLGAVFVLRGEHTRAAGAYSTTLTIARELGGHGEVAAAWGLMGLAEIARRQDNFAEARHHADDALVQATQAGDTATLEQAHLVSANVYGAACEWSRAFVCAQMALVYAHARHNTPDEAKALHALGIIYMTGLHRPARALTLVQRAAEIYAAMNSGHLLALLDVLLGNLYEQLDDWPNAERRYRQAIVRFERLNALHDLAMARQNFGMALTERAQWEEAERLLRAALEDWHRLDAPVGHVSTLSALGDWYAHQGRCDDALQTWKVALELAASLPSSATLGEIVAFIRKRQRDLAAD